jgi:hypothetical protein
MSRPPHPQRNPNRLAVQGLSINASIASVDILKALYTLKRAGWVRTSYGWEEGSTEEQETFWSDEHFTPAADVQPTIREDSIMRRKDITVMDSIIAEAQIHRSGRWERTPMGGWRRLLLEDKENSGSNTEAGSQTEQGSNTENDDTLVGDDSSFLAYKGTKRSFDEYEEHSRPYTYSPALQPLPPHPTAPPRKKRKPVDPSRVRTAPNVDLALYDVSSITLPHELTETIPIFSTCDSVRSQILTLLSTSGMTRAAFMRFLCAAAFPTSKKGIQDRQLANFQAQKGEWRGRESNVFYAAYVYLEKLRFMRGEEKSEERVQREGELGEGGVVRKVERVGGVGKGEKEKVGVESMKQDVILKLDGVGGCERIADKVPEQSGFKAVNMAT